ncbi:hypothetical protein GCM10010517_60910 [Streptosporangium fragile]|uniref:Tyr recombinase domain-containing protein n=1 Tax=Streptosporangium fragile TaxID=46186 RepID=A0ABN3W530_9ACTN
MYPAYVLVLVLGLRLGEALRLRWEDVDLGNAETTIGRQLQRVAGKPLHRQTKTDASDATLPFPEIVTAALRARRRARAEAREAAGESWQETGLVFTTASGCPGSMVGGMISFRPGHLRLCSQRSDHPGAGVPPPEASCHPSVADPAARPRRATRPGPHLSRLL